MRVLPLAALALLCSTSVHADENGSQMAGSEVGTQQLERAEAVASATLSVKTGGEWKDGKYVGGEFQNVDSLTVPPHPGPGVPPIRFEGPGWESSRIAYRIYLDSRNATDIFGKRQPEPVLNHIGGDGDPSYHDYADWGQDILYVGDSLGIGSFGYWDGKQVQRVSDLETLTAKVLEDGPDEAAVEVLYQGWSAGGQVQDATARFSIAKDSSITHVSLDCGSALDEIATGIIQLPNSHVIESEDTEKGSDKWAYLATWGTQSLAKERMLGLALFYPLSAEAAVTEDANNHVVVLQLDEGKVDYAFGAVWEADASGVKTESEFRKWLESTRQELSKH